MTAFDRAWLGLRTVLEQKAILDAMTPQPSVLPLPPPRPTRINVVVDNRQVIAAYIASGIIAARGVCDVDGAIRVFWDVLDGLTVGG